MHLEQNPDKILSQIMSVVLTQQSQFERIYRELVAEMEARNVYFKTDKQLNKAQKEFVENYFEERLHTRIVPLMIESIPAMPLLSVPTVFSLCARSLSRSIFSAP